MDLPINQIICGDCLEVMADWPDGCVNGVVCDWPYSSGTRREGAKGIRKSMNRTTSDNEWFELDSLTTHSFIWLARSVAWECCRLVSGGEHSFWFTDWRMYPFVFAAVETAGWRIANLVVWDKVLFGMGAHFRNQHELIVHASKGVGNTARRNDVPNVLRSPAIRDGQHPTQKPLGIIFPLLSVTSDEGQCILDPFCGSGTTCVAAKMLGRNYIGIDISEEYCEIARERLRSVDTGVPAKEAKAGQMALFG